MQNIHQRPFLTTVKGIYTLTRFLPTISWGISASLIGLAFALPGATITSRDWFNYFLVVMNIILFHGIASHAINDLEDWRSGTDKASPGFYSGGSKVIRNNLLTIENLTGIAIVTMLLGIIISFYLAFQYGLIIIVFMLIALWSAISYTQPPLRLSYQPLLGEWLASFPAVAAVTFLSYFIFRGRLITPVIIAGIAHSVLSIGLLMFHHISDVAADLKAEPPKVTTVAYVAARYGFSRSNLVAALYFALIIPLGIVGFIWYPILILSVLFALPCLVLSIKVEPTSIADITSKETYIFALLIGHAISYLLVLGA